MEHRTLGKTGLRVSRLGAGLSEIGQELSLDETGQAGEVLNTALDNGINPLDTASCYVNSEEFVGATVAHRRDDYVPASKAGHGGLISEGRNPVRPARRRLGATGAGTDERAVRRSPDYEAA